jgi:hypothetical protein
MLVSKTLRISMPAFIGNRRGKKPLLLIGGKVHRGSVCVVVKVDLHSREGTKIGAQQIYVLEMRVGIRRVHLDILAIDLNGKIAWNRVGSKQLVACLESVISGYKCLGTPHTSCERYVKGLPLSNKK